MTDLQKQLDDERQHNAFARVELKAKMNSELIMLERLLSDAKDAIDIAPNVTLERIKYSLKRIAAYRAELFPKK